MSMEKVVVVKKATHLEELLRRHATVSQVKFYLESRGDSFEECKDAHEMYQTSLSKVLSSIPRTTRQQILDKRNLDTYVFGDKDLVVAVGDPGLVANLGKYVGNQPVMSINPDQGRYASTFACGTSESFAQLFSLAMHGDLPLEALTLAEAKLDNGQIIYGLNEIFLGKPDQTFALYTLEYQGKKEKQSSSGLIAATGSGSTAWLTSIMSTACRLAGLENDTRTFSFARDAKYLAFAVREAFPAPGAGTSLVYGKISREKPLKVTSLMPERGIITSDGMLDDYVEFNRGRSALISPADKKLYLIKPWEENHDDSKTKREKHD